MQKTILITGCSSGIGNATCHYLQNRGYKVFASARKEQDVTKLREEGFEAFLLDVTNSQHIILVLNKILAETGGTLYALCNNAGYALPGALEDLSKKSLQQQFETNVFGLQELTNQLLPVFRRQGFGRIIHISSILGLVSMPFRGAYNASKYAVEGLADTLRLELKPTEIYVSLIEPGPIKTRFRDNALAAYQHHITPEISIHHQNYQSFLANFLKKKDKLLFGDNPDAVAKKIYKVLESNKPKPRYLVTFPAHLFALLKRILPTRWLDALITKIAQQELKT